MTKSKKLNANLINSLSIIVVVFIGAMLFFGNFATKRVSQKAVINQIGSSSVPTTKKVLVLNYDPILESAGNVKLHTYFKWSDPAALEPEYLRLVQEASHGNLNYQIVERINLDDFPAKVSGFKFTDSSYLNCKKNPSTCNNEMVNLSAILAKNKVCEKVNAGTIDEVWIWGGEFFGHSLSTMAGPGAIYLSNPPLTSTTCNKKLTITGFNYNKTITEMLEYLGMRTISVMGIVFNYQPFAYVPNLSNAFGRFTAIETLSPGQSGCGNILRPPNGRETYDWKNETKFTYSCDDWNSTYPSMVGTIKQANCWEWGCNSFGYNLWWLKHIPYSSGKTDGVTNNWWSYLADYDSTVQSKNIGPQYFTISNGNNDWNKSCSPTYDAKEVYVGVNKNCSPSKPYIANFNFEKVIIPKGAKISKAILQYTQDGPFANPLNLVISLQSGNFTSDNAQWLVNEPWAYQKIGNSSNFSNILQQLVDANSWKSGNPIIVRVGYKSGTGQRRIFAFERSKNAAPKLVIEYTSP